MQERVLTRMYVNRINGHTERVARGTETVNIITTLDRLLGGYSYATIATPDATIALLRILDQTFFRSGPDHVTHRKTFAIARVEKNHIKRDTVAVIDNRQPSSRSQLFVYPPVTDDSRETLDRFQQVIAAKGARGTTIERTHTRGPVFEELNAELTSLGYEPIIPKRRRVR